MKRAMFLVAALAAAAASHGQTLYKHVDKNGRVTYTDQPPASADAKPIHVPKSVSDAPPRSYVQQDKELEKKRKELREKAGKPDESAKKEEAAAQRCTQARTSYQMYEQGGRIYKTDEKGERTFMSDADIESARERSRREMDEACKGR